MQNTCVFLVFKFMWNNNSGCLLSVYAPDTWYIWRCMHTRMLVCSDVLMCTPTFFSQRKLKIKTTLRIRYAGCYFLFLSPVPGILIMKYYEITNPPPLPGSLGKPLSFLDTLSPPGPALHRKREAGRQLGAQTTGSHPLWLPTSMHLAFL